MAARAGVARVTDAVKRPAEWKGELQLLQARRGVCCGLCGVTLARLWEGNEGRGWTGGWEKMATSGEDRWRFLKAAGVAGVEQTCSPILCMSALIQILLVRWGLFSSECKQNCGCKPFLPHTHIHALSGRVLHPGPFLIYTV